MSTPHLVRSGVTIHAPIPAECEEILSAEALALVAELHRRFNGRRLELLAARVERQKAKRLAVGLPEENTPTRIAREEYEKRKAAQP